ncbi:hypothetical protein AAHE18_20G100900 [Arachis hypogaea]
MEKYFKKTSSLEIGSQNNSSTSSNKRRFIEFEVESLIADPEQRPKISSYHPNDRDKVRCAYLQKGPCQPRTHDFPQTASALMRPKQHITAAIEKQYEQAKKNYRIHLTTTIDCLRFLLRQELAFRDNDETDDSVNQGNFLELLNFLAQHNEEIGRAFKNAHRNLKLITSSIQKDIVRAATREITKVIVDDPRDISIKKQMSVCLRYVNKEGQVREHFVGLVHVSNTNTLSLKLALESLLETYNLSLSRVCGQGYDGASSHYGTILRLISLFPSVVNVLKYVEEDGNNSKQRAKACHLLNVIQSFEFIFNLYLMKNILGVTNELSQALQRNDQDIVNAMALVKVSKQRLQIIRDDGWSLLLDEVSLFYNKHNITVPIMDDIFVSQGRSRHKAQKISNFHHFQVEIFYQVVDRQLQELNNHFTEVDTELLLCIACSNPRHLFFAFDKEKLIQLAQFYPLEFSSTQLLALDSQLENFILDVRSDDQFSDLNGIAALS